MSTGGIAVQSAVRAWVEPRKLRRRATGRNRMAVPWRPQPYGERVLVFDTETTTDAAQRLLFGFFRLYDRDRLIEEGLIAVDVLDQPSMEAIAEYAARCRLPIYSRERFVEEVFYPEVYICGTLCVGFNLPFDLTRIAIHAGVCRGENRRKFRIVLSRRLRWHDLRIESASGRAAFINFTPKRKLYAWERPFFAGRFCDVSMVAAAFTGERHSLRSAGKAFRAYTRKMKAPELGGVDRRSLLYGRQDVRATWALYKSLRNEYTRHSFATFANERRRPQNSRYMGQLYSSASIAKQYLRKLGIDPLLQKQPNFDPKWLGLAAAAYFGGRSDVRVRKVGVPVRVVDFTSMYATIFCLQRLDQILTTPQIGIKSVTTEIRALVSQVASDHRSLFNPEIWLKFNCLVMVDPNWAILPVRMRTKERDPFTIAVTPLKRREGRWYTLGDVIAAVLLGGPEPVIRKAIRFVPKGSVRSKRVKFRNTVDLLSNTAFFKPIVEQKNIAKRGAEQNPELAGLELGLKQMAASGTYGIYAEVNVTPTKDDTGISGEVYSDICYPSPKVHNERPGAYTNPIIASLITGGARLMLALLESEVVRHGGVFAFCDTDSLAIPCGDRPASGIPCIPEEAIVEIVERFDALNPYDREAVPHLLKREHSKYPDLQCFAISAKRYVLYRWRSGNRIEIIKASESALGAIIGRSRNETTKKLANRIWLWILMQHFDVNPGQRHRAEPLTDFDVPLRRKFPISQPTIYQRLQGYNRPKSYDFKVKPFGFVQSVVLAKVTGNADVLPIAPFEIDLAKSRRLPWVDFNTGEAIRLDWIGSGMDGALEVVRLSEYVEAYHRHPESKAADRDGNPAGQDTIGLLGRLRLESGPPIRIGKEVDRLDEEEGAALEPEQPIEYERDDLADDIAYLATFPQAATARDLGLTERGWRKILKGRSVPKSSTAERICQVGRIYGDRLNPATQKRDA